MSKKPRIKAGDVFVTNEGCEAVVIEYRGALDVLIEFQDSGRYRRSVYADNLRRGYVKNPLHPSVYGVGFIGVGRFTPTVKRRRTPEYIKWSGMMERCYSDRFHAVKPSYIGCTVVKEWHDFQSFAEWITKQSAWGCDDYDLDKDMLVTGNKEYSPSACSLMPRRINAIITGSPRVNGLPYGISWNNSKKCYVAQCCTGTGVSEHIGYYDDKYDAFTEYKSFKERIIKEAAIEYKERITEELYDALMLYEVQP